MDNTFKIGIWYVENPEFNSWYNYNIERYSIEAVMRMYKTAPHRWVITNNK